MTPQQHRKLVHLLFDEDNEKARKALDYLRQDFKSHKEVLDLFDIGDEELFWETVLTFGKYKGTTLYTLATSDPGYVEWLSQNSKGFLQTAAKFVLKRLQEAMDAA